MDSRLFLSRTFHRVLEPPLSLVRLIIVLTSILAFGVVAYDLVTDRQRTEQAALDAARQQALVQSRAAAEMVQATLDRFDFALQTAREAAITGPRAMAFQEQVIARTLPSNLALQQFRIGADGYLEYSSLGPAPRNYLGDRDYFKELAADTADRLVVSPPVLGRLTHKWSIQVARAIQRDGRFDGVVSIAVSPEEWAKQLASFEAGPRDTLTLVDARGHVLLRTLDGASHFGKQAPQKREYILHPEQREGHYVAHASVDGVLRVYGWTRLRNPGLVMLSGIALEDALAPVREMSHRMRLRAVVSAVLFTALIGALLLALARYERAGRRLAQQEAHSRHIVEHMADGIVVVDADERIVRVNPAFCAITGFSPGALDGQPVSTLCADGDPCELGRLVSQTGSGHWSGDFDGRRADGSHYIGHAVVSAVADSDEHQMRRVVLLSDVTELRRKDREMWHQANFDRLTGLPNRALLADRIDSMLRRARRNHTEVAVLFIDLDDFKPVNDDFGHDVGDLLLREVAGRLQRLFRDEDTVSRLGGDEFVVAMHAELNSGFGQNAAGKIVASLSEPFQVAGQTLTISCSVGVARFPDDGDSADSLIQHADHAMYRAKKQGRSRWSL
ncbi:diguanylate cyclase [Thauera aminoaromatica]|uniref:Diguanylate cyclase n=1 Tax=Thauera aminoaromatica TaxID=164330 RepID=A0A5C7SDS4_THASP|nr:diguanylate cyclase [Thauera aminoaromatica]TXH81105.1 MAG: diguanylate cyclase [Thauera aminoaromatica]